MPFNGNKITQYKDGRDAATGTLARGSTFDSEFNRLYDNDNYLKTEIDKLGGAALDTDVNLAANSDQKIASQKAARAFIEKKVSDLIAGSPAALDTLKELSVALGNDANFSSNVIDRIYAASQRNLVYNGDFRFFTNQVGTVNWYDYRSPDGWVFTDNGSDGKVGYDTAAKCCKIQSSSDGTGARILKQNLHGFFGWSKYLSGVNFSLKMMIKGPAGVTVKITDGITVTNKVLQGTGAIETIDLSALLNNAPTELSVSVEISSASALVEIYKVYGNRGKYAVEDSQTNNAETLGGKALSEIVQIGAVNQTIAGIKTFSSIPVLPASNPVNSNDAVRKAYVDAQIAAHDSQHDDRYVQLSGAQTIAGIKTFSSIPVLPATDPTNANEVGRKAYIDFTKRVSFGRFTNTDLAIADSDTFVDVLVDVTAADRIVTLPPKATNRNRVLCIYHAAGSNKVIVRAHTNDPNTLSFDAMSEMWLTKPGDYIVFHESQDTGFWEIINKRITVKHEWNTSAGYGSTDARVLKFTNQVHAAGNFITHNHGAYGSKGLEIAIKQSGHYFLRLMFWASVNGQAGYITKNSTALSTNPVWNSNEVLGYTRLYGHIGEVFVKQYLAKNDIVRFMGDGNGIGSNEIVGSIDYLY